MDIANRVLGLVTWAFLFFFIGASTGCATVKVKRDLTDQNGKVLGHVEVEQNMATPEGAARLVGSVGDLQKADLADRADVRATQVAAASVEKGQPTTSNTSGGRVTSGYVGYGYGQYGGYGYGGYGQVMVPGASPEMMWVEQAGLQSYSLPPLGEPTAQTVQAPSATGATTGSFGSEGLATCPQDRMPMTPAEQVACIRQDLNGVLRVHR